MPLEIERKFLLTSEAWRTEVRWPGIRYRQGYLSAAEGVTVRVRTCGSQAFLTIKGPADPSGLTRSEFEYPIPSHDAEQLLATLCRKPIIDKTRHLIPVHSSGDQHSLTWEIDEFHGGNAPLILAEIELPAADHDFPHPPWLGREVTAEPRYRNASLVDHPYSAWSAAEQQ